MGSSTVQPLSSAQREALLAQADASGFISFDSFMDVALYHEIEGYYRRDRNRIGQREDTDFYTASSLGPVFGELVAASAAKLLGERDPAGFTFVEIGAERGRSVLDGVAHPFAAVQPVAIGQETDLSGACVVFSNELFDAQPCRRFVGTGSGWAELGVRVVEEGITEARHDCPTLPAVLPAQGPEGYHLDLPEAATALAGRIAAQPWHGLFLAFDYGKPWAELLQETPQGTVRAYHQHRQNTELLAMMGEQDLTCHVCWDHLRETLEAQGFESAELRSQEAFLVGEAGAALAQIMAAEAGQMGSRKNAIMQLLHPSSLGQKFQVLNAWRDEV